MSEPQQPPAYQPHQYQPPPYHQPPYQHPPPQYQQPPPLQCRFCGSVPAVAATFRQHRGMILLMQFIHQDGPFCRNCGLAAYRSMTQKTLLQGWWGAASLFITPVIALINLVRSRRVKALGPPVRDPALDGHVPPPASPGKPLYRRPLAVAGVLLPIVVIGGVILVSRLTTTPKDTTGCVARSGDRYALVSCDDSTSDGRVVGLVDTQDQCPATADIWLEPATSGGKVTCVDLY